MSSVGHRSTLSRRFAASSPLVGDLCITSRNRARLAATDVLIPSNTGRNDRLDRIDRLIDWPKVAAILDGVHAAPEGRPAYRPITMVKIIVLQQWYDTSDVGMEEALRDRLSFRRFAELTLMDAVPDHSTISRFRKKITERGLARALFAEALPAVGGDGHAGEARNDEGGIGR